MTKKRMRKHKINVSQIGRKRGKRTKRTIKLGKRVELSATTTSQQNYPGKKSLALTGE